MQRRPIHRPLLGLAGSGSACLAGSCCQSWNGFNGVPGVHSLFVYGIDNAIAAGCLRKEASFCMLPQIDRRGRCEGRKPMWCCARLCSGWQLQSGGCSAETEFALLCRLALCSPKKIQMAMVGAWCYEWRAAVRSGRDGEEERAGGDEHWEQTMRRVCRTTSFTLRRVLYVAMRWCFTRDCPISYRIGTRCVSESQI